MDTIDPDTEAALSALEELALRLIAALLARDAGAGEAVQAALAEAIDGSPGRPGAWFRIGSGPMLARLVEAWERLRRAATNPEARAQRPGDAAEPL